MKFITNENAKKFSSTIVQTFKMYVTEKQHYLY